MTDTETKHRPYWHVDAKWIFGIIFSFSLGISLLAYGLTAITAEKPAVDALTMVIATMYSRNGLDDATEIDQLKAKMNANPDGTFQPIPNVNITIKWSDVANMTPREMRLSFFRKLAQPIYTGNIDNLTTDPAQKKVFLRDTMLIRLIASVETHQILWNVFLVTAILSAICLLPFIYFSDGLAKLANPGAVLVYNSFLGLVLSIIATTIHFPDATVTTGDPGPLGAVGPAISPLVPQFSQIFLQIYLVAFGIGMVLLVLALIGRIFIKRKVKEKEKEE